ncbi:GDP-mannose 4,6-dehydratase [Saccharicrinis fermentans]|uniref:dTDP-glucose 4,6-dehydratase n=1 Tax=Saccharicrinis fermentans DSM 9555 = JCM 21142 TaxID=869213 RepID=W7YHN8_9BACT|nr:GDP-mannose 4,6-dehydratase [Saccharicrinis fermentans]GAF03981.1 dTDP-glucose 4,6-dehydratase [Saccharicrinis fermentans DSM 9555 = JCM 21142]
MHKILVTGSAGFIGSHLTEALLAQGYQVVGVDNFDPYYDRKLKEANLSQVSSHPNFTFHELDLCDETSVRQKLEEKFDCIVHLAAKAGVRPSIENPQSYIDNNISATRCLLDLMKDTASKKMIFASSSSVYGNIPDTPWNEELDVSKPISPYAFSKKSCELLNHSYHHLYGLDFINVRFFTVFGPRQRPDLAINKFTRLLYEGQAIPMYGDGSTARDYTFVQDIVSGIIKSIEYINSRDGVFENMNLGNNSPVKLIDLIKTIAEVTNQKLTIEQLPMQPGDVDITFADISKAQRMIGYEPKTSLKEGLTAFKEWYLTCPIQLKK